MRAFVMKGYGGPEMTELRDVAVPVVGAGQLLVKVRAAGLNPIDFKIRDGMVKSFLKLKLPVILGSDLAGDVISVGPGVTAFKVGDRVLAQSEAIRLGAFAEQACVEAEEAIVLPATVDYAKAAALPVAAGTALQALRDHLAVVGGTKIIISGGAGGVGTFAIQLAKSMGAVVTTTASPKGDALVRALGADEVIDYTTTSIDAKGRRFDVGFDLIGGTAQDEMFRAVKPGGNIVAITGTPEPRTALQDLGGSRFLALALWFMSWGVRAKARRANVGYRFLSKHPNRDDLSRLAGMVADGKLKVLIDRSAPLAEIAEAMAYLESGRAKGKVVVTMD